MFYLEVVLQKNEVKVWQNYGKFCLRQLIYKVHTFQVTAVDICLNVHEVFEKEKVVYKSNSYSYVFHAVCEQSCVSINSQA